jgi:cytochrome P450
MTTTSGGRANGNSNGKLPPGSAGFPIVGETFAFLKDSFAFVSDRQAKYGPVFRTQLLGKPAVVMIGPTGSEKFIDTNVIARADSAPPHIVELFAGSSLPFLDDSAHRGRKSLILHAFSREALASYLPALDEIVAATLSRWADQPEVHGIHEMKRLAIKAIMANFVGISDDVLLDSFVAKFSLLTAGFGALPIKFPGTTLSRALAARDVILATLRTEVAKHRSAPRGDGLSRVLSAKLEDGSTLDDAAALLEVHHMFLAGYIVFAEFAGIVLTLDKHQDIAANLRAEVMQTCPSGALTQKALANMPQLLQFVKEVKRYTPILPFIFAKAKMAFMVEGYEVPKDWMVLWALRETNMWPASFREPAKFDPARFGGDRKEDMASPFAFVPQGVGEETGHRCPGLDYATLFMQLFTAHLVRDFTLSLPEQDTRPMWKMIPPEPTDGLRLRLKPAPAAP